MYILNKIAFSGNNFSPSTNVKTQQDKQSMEDTLKVLLLIQSFQTNGYLKANLDPLNMDIRQKNVQLIPIYQILTTLDYKTYGFTEEDLDREFMIHTDKITVIS
jgi:2-oxoglutarate dehydrogenase E1 component